MSDAQPTASVVTTTRSKGPSVLQIVIVIAILGGGILVTALTSSISRVAEPGIRLQDGRPFLLEKVRDWSGSAQQGLSEDELKILPADTQGARRTYTDSSSNMVYCSVVLEGSDVTSIHRPELCLKGQGWMLENGHVERIPVDAVPGGGLWITCLDAKRTVPGGETRAVFAYWFVGKDRLTPYHWKRILLTTKDRVLLNRNARWAYFLILAPVVKASGPETAQQGVEHTMQVISRFVQDIYPTLTPD